MSVGTSLLEELRDHPAVQRSIMVACMHTPDIPSCADLSRWKGVDIHG